MVTYQCKICKQSVELAVEGQINICPHCKAPFIVPNQFRDNANKRNIYRLADEALANRNFDVALTYYKRILMVDAKEPDAHFGFLMSKYGVEISRRAESYEHIIFHRIEREIITDDPSYHTMIQYCPEKLLYYYQGLCRIIAQQQKKMLDISNNERPYDIYINCTAGPGTADYLLANQVGHVLQQAGYRVFLSPIHLANVPLEDKNLYEMAVAEKAQAMIVVATATTDNNDARYLAVWKRFLAYRRQDAGRKMLSVFQGILPEQLPLELQPLQSIKCEGSSFQDEVLTKINEMFGRKNQDVSTTRQILDYLHQADELLAAGNYTQAADTFQLVQQLDAEESRAHWGLVCAATNNLTKPNFSYEVHTNYQRALQFAKGPQRDQYQQAMSALMAEPAWANLVQLTNNLTNIQVLSQRNVQRAIANAREYLAKNDSRLAKIEDYFLADRVQKEANELKKAYDRRDVLVEPLFEEQGKAENIYNACGSGHSDLFSSFRSTGNFLPLSMLLMLLGQFCLTANYSTGYFYEGPTFLFATVFFYAAVIIGAVVVARVLHLLAEKVNRFYYFPYLAAAAIGIASFFIYKKHDQQIFIIYLAIIIVLWLVLRVTTAIIASSIRSNAGLLKKAAKQVLLINDQIQASYQTNMQAHFQKYGVKNPRIPEYTVRNSDGFHFRPEDKRITGPMFLLAWSAVLLAVLVLGATWFSNQLHASAWKNIVSISAGNKHVVGLREDGTCVANGSNAYEQCQVDQWKDVVQIDTGDYFTVALFADGTVDVAYSSQERFAEVENWTDIVQIDVSDTHILALKEDGTCVASGSNGTGEKEVSDWSDIKLIRAATNDTGSISIGVTSTGHVEATLIPYWENIHPFLETTTGTGEERLAVRKLFGHYGSFVGLTDVNECIWFGDNFNNQLKPVDNWDGSQIKEVYSSTFTVALKKDGSIIFAGDSSAIAAQVKNWKNVESLSGNRTYVLGLRKDGTVCAAGDNSNGQCNVDEWENVRSVHAGSNIAYGILEDGSVCAAGKSSGDMAYLSDKNPLELLQFWLGL